MKVVSKLHGLSDRSCLRACSSGNGFINGKIIIQKHLSMLQRKLNVSVLLPYLNKYRMITTDLHEELTLQTTTNAAKVDRLVVELLKRGGDYLVCLIKCLRESAKEELATSHAEIATVLEKELGRQNTSGIHTVLAKTKTSELSKPLVFGHYQ